jgi:hypothetical protein
MALLSTTPQKGNKYTPICSPGPVIGPGLFRVLGGTKSGHHWPKVEQDRPKWGHGSTPDPIRALHYTKVCSTTGQALFHLLLSKKIDNIYIFLYSGTSGTKGTKKIEKYRIRGK